LKYLCTSRDRWVSSRHRSRRMQVWVWSSVSGGCILRHDLLCARPQIKHVLQNYCLNLNPPEAKHAYDDCNKILQKNNECRPTLSKGVLSTKDTKTTQDSYAFRMGKPSYWLWITIFIHFHIRFSFKEGGSSSKRSKKTQFSATSYSHVTPHKDETKQGRRCNHATWSLVDPWAAFQWV